MHECRLSDYGEDGLLCETHDLAEASACTHAADVLQARVRELLEGGPGPNGEYLHLVECSGDRRQPPGTPGITCCCMPGLRSRLSSAEAAERRLLGLLVELQWLPREGTKYCRICNNWSREGHKVDCRLLAALAASALACAEANLC